LAATIRTAGGQFLDRLEYVETYRDADKDGAGKKRLLFTFTLRASDRTLTSEEADATRQSVIDACGHEHQAVLLA
jgi:phenylalanyl-tRNA synthetase beta chain